MNGISKYMYKKNLITILLCFFFLAIAASLNAQAPEEQSLSDTTNFKLEFMSFNSKDNDYHAVPYKNGFVFSSSRNSSWGILYESTTGDEFTDLFYVAPVNGTTNWTKPKKFSNAINSRLSEGPFCFNKTGDVIYFTTNSSTTGKDHQGALSKINTLKIFKSEFINNAWSSPQPFIFNNNNFGIGHPSLSLDGKRLFFASNMPGGYGGSDIYVSYLSKGQWGKPINLGNKINTKANEVFPFIADNGILYFSSNGHQGHGKLDIYSASFENSEWKGVKNLEAPINSGDDDISFILDSDGKFGYFSSDRRNGKEDNIYRFQSLKTPCDTMPEINKCFTFFEQSSIEGMNLPLEYEWDLGDGTKQKGLTISHCYAHAGEFKILLNVMDTLTKRVFFNEASYTITIEEVKTPYMEISNPALAHELIEFDGRKSKLTNCKINELIWDFGDGVKSIGPKVSHTYHQAGNYEVSMTARGTDTLNNEIEQCIFKILYIPDSLAKIPLATDSLKKVTEVARQVYSGSKAEDITYKVQVATSEVPIPTDSEKFKGLKDVSEYQSNGVYGYTVGEGRSLEEMYPLYSDVKVKGFDEAQVVAFKNNKLISSSDSTKKNLLDGKTYTHINGRVMSRFGDPLEATIVLENLSTGKIISRFLNEPDQGKFTLFLPNGDIYGYYAEKDSFYSISNFIDLRHESRNLEVKKNIELISYDDLYEDNLSLRINNLFFGTKEYKIASESYPELARLARVIKNNPHVTAEISGHSDNVGDENFNLILSQKRADSVKEYLKSLGCPDERIISRGYGFTHPLVSNHTERGRYINRRVEIRFLSK